MSSESNTTSPLLYTDTGLLQVIHIVVAWSKFSIRRPGTYQAAIALAVRDTMFKVFCHSVTRAVSGFGSAQTECSAQCRHAAC